MQLSGFDYVCTKCQHTQNKDGALYGCPICSHREVITIVALSKRDEKMADEIQWRELKRQFWSFLIFIAIFFSSLQFIVWGKSKYISRS